MWVWLAVLAIFILLLHLVFPKKYNSRSTRRKMSKVPGPLCIPYFGNAYKFFIPTEEYLKQLIKLTDQYKPILKLDFLGNYFVICTELDDLKIVLNSHQHIAKGDDYQMLEPWLGEGLLTSAGKKWADHRKLLTPAFHFKILSTYINVITKNTEILLEQISARTGDDFVEIDPLISLCTLDIICETAMGTEIFAQTRCDSEYVKAVLRMSQLYRIRQMSPWLHTHWVFHLSPTGWEQKKILKILHGFTNKVIRERKIAYKQEKSSAPITGEEISENSYLGGKKKMSFLDILIEMSETEKKITETEIREQVDTFMFEGHDTTAAALIWALYELGWNHDVQEKAYQEIKEIFKDSDRMPTSDDLAEMKYLERVIKETLRLYPSVPVISRNLKEDVQIRDYVLPAETNFPIFIYYIHRDPKLYPNPDKFDPDRFLPELMQGRHPFSYIPFSAGPRNCIGQRFAMMEEKLVISQILRKFKVTSLDKREDVTQLAELVLRSKNNLRMTFEPR